MTTTEALVRFTGTTPYPANERVSVGRVRMFGHRAWVAYRRHEQEWARRSRCDVGAVEDISTLAVLMELPVGIPVPLSCLHPTDRRVLRQLPDGIVHYEENAVVRDLDRVITLLLAIVPGDEDWASAAGAASGFAVHCPRLVALSRPADRAAGVVHDVSQYGIGVVAGGSNPRVLAEPAPMPEWRFTPGGWGFDEEIYAQVRPGASPSGG